MSKRAVILYVEDNDYLRASVPELLERPSRQFICCAMAREALDMLQTPTQQIDLLITDLNLPDAPGLDVVLSCSVARPHCPIIVCSGHDLAASSPSVARQVSYISKPFDVDEFEALVDRLLGEGRERP